MGVDLDPGARARPGSPPRAGPRPRGRGAEAHGAVDLDVEADRERSVEILHGDVVDGQPPPRRDEHHPLQDGLVVERTGSAVTVSSGVRQILRDRGGDRLLDGGDALERQGARNVDEDLAEHPPAGGPHPHALDRDDAGDALGAGCARCSAKPFGAASSSVARVRCARPEARDGDESATPTATSESACG